MALSSNEINAIVEKVVTHLEAGNTPRSRSGKHPAGIFDTLDEAFNAARTSQKLIRNLELRGKAIAAMREAAKKHARELAEIAVAETGLGRVDDKIKKIRAIKSFHMT